MSKTNRRDISNNDISGTNISNKDIPIVFNMLLYLRIKIYL